MTTSPTDPRATGARYDLQSGAVTVDLANGCAFTFPARALEGLEIAGDEDLAAIEVEGRGYGLHWPRLDVDFTVAGLLMGVFGTAKWMAREQARRAGRATSDAKAAAARANGAKGGRPKKPA